MKHTVPAHATFRPGTVDEDVWRDVIEGNVYRLPVWFDPGDAVLDLGGHTGSFAWRAANSGASVVSVEAGRENYHLLTHNLRPLWHAVNTVHAAAWRSDVPPCELSFQPNWVPANTGGGCVMGDAATAPSHAVVAVPLDDLLRLRASWRLLKLDIEGAEFACLYTSKELMRVKAVTGEYHERARSKEFADAGPCLMSNLETYLADNGFAVEVVPEPSNPKMGMFFASRNK